MMRFFCDATLAADSAGLVCGMAAGLASLAGDGVGIVQAFYPEHGWTIMAPAEGASVSVQTFGECSVISGGVVSAGDFFTADADGKAAATTSGFALGRILEAGSADEIVRCVISPTSL